MGLRPLACELWLKAFRLEQRHGSGFEVSREPSGGGKGAPGGREARTQMHSPSIAGNAVGVTTFNEVTQRSY